MRSRREQRGDRHHYAVTVEAFFLKAMAGRLDAVARAALREVGIALDEPLRSVCPAAVFHRGVALAAATAYPGALPEVALYRAGRDHVDAFVKSYPGKMMAALARQLDGRAILEHTATFLRLGNNYAETRLRVLGPGRVELWVNDVGGVPAFYRGILQRGLEIAGVSGVTVAELPGAEPPAASYAVGWTRG